MKFLLVAFAIVGFTSNAQSELEAQTTNSTTKSVAGIKAGYNLASVSIDGNSDTDFRHGLHVGFYGESYIAEVASIQLEVLYSQQGYELKSDSGTFTQKLNYINVPISLKIYPIKNFYLEAGPQIGLAISHKEEFDSELNLFDTEQEFDPKSFDYGANLGFGIKANSGFSIGARYYFGLGDIYDEGNPRNRVLQISAGLAF